MLSAHNERCLGGCIINEKCGCLTGAYICLRRDTEFRDTVSVSNGGILPRVLTLYSGRVPLKVY